MGGGSEIEIVQWGWPKPPEADGTAGKKPDKEGTPSVPDKEATPSVTLHTEAVTLNTEAAARKPAIDPANVQKSKPKSRTRDK